MVSIDAMGRLMDFSPVSTERGDKPLVDPRVANAKRLRGDNIII